MKKINLPLAVGPLVLVGLLAGAANADNTWGSYHWDISTVESRSAPLIFGDNLTTSAWTSILGSANDDWNLLVGPEPEDTETPLHTAVGSSDENTSSSCDPVGGRVEVCNGLYGTGTGWLGIASIWVKRGRSGHIVQGVVKLNDSFFILDWYNIDPIWREFVMCQELGHTLGLDHRNSTFDGINNGTCMDYTYAPNGGEGSFIDNKGEEVFFDGGGVSNLSPDAHDYETLVAIYAHLNPTDGEGGSGKGGGGGGGNKKPKKADAGVDIDLNNPAEWGQAVQRDALGRNSLFERTLPNGQVLITHVLWAY